MYGKRFEFWIILQEPRTRLGAITIAGVTAEDRRRSLKNVFGSKTSGFFRRSTSKFSQEYAEIRDFF